jgi:hypothetical protein
MPWQDGFMTKTTDPEEPRSQLTDAIFTTVRGGFRILSGIVQMAAGITRVVAVTVLKVASAAEEAVVGTDGDGRDPEPESEPTPRAAHPRPRKQNRGTTKR